MKGDTGPSSEPNLHTLVLRKFDNDWWTFDAAERYPSNLTKNNDAALIWLTHIKYIDVVIL